MKKSPITPPTILPPSINRQHSYTSDRPSPHGARPDTNGSAKNILSQVASRTASPRRSCAAPPPEAAMERRRSWEDCVHQRDGYISFPDFDEVSESGR